jgi:hypothetical protein
MDTAFDFTRASLRLRSDWILSRAASAFARLASACCLLFGGAIGGVVLIEQGRAGSDLGAAPDREAGEKALLGRPGLDVIGFGIALPLDRGRLPRPG